MNLQVITTGIQAIKIVEDLLPGKGRGDAKLVAVRAMMLEFADKIPEIQQQWEGIKRLIAFVVGAYNKLGIFKKAA